jgi:hypothetical protein
MDAEGIPSTAQGATQEMVMYCQINLGVDGQGASLAYVFNPRSMHFVPQPMFSDFGTKKIQVAFICGR